MNTTAIRIVRKIKDRFNKSFFFTFLEFFFNGIFRVP